jgi:Uma2 family endonuclease
MSLGTVDYRDAVDRMPAGASLVFHDCGWDEYERVLRDLEDRPALRVTYDDGRLQIVSTSPEHEGYKDFILRLVQVLSEVRGVTLETRGSTTWKRRALRKGTEPDTCFYIANAHHIVGKLTIDLESDPPPDVAVEIDVTSNSLSKFGIYAALGVPEIWRYDTSVAQFYVLTGSDYRIVTDSRAFPGLTPAILSEALDASKHQGQTRALAAIRRQFEAP